MMQLPNFLKPGTDNPNLTYADGVLSQMRLFSRDPAVWGAP